MKSVIARIVIFAVNRAVLVTYAVCLRPLTSSAILILIVRVFMTQEYVIWGKLSRYVHIFIVSNSIMSHGPPMKIGITNSGFLFLAFTLSLGQSECSAKHSFKNRKDWVLVLKFTATRCLLRALHIWEWFMNLLWWRHVMTGLMFASRFGNLLDSAKHDIDVL